VAVEVEKKLGGCAGIAAELRQAGKRIRFGQFTRGGNFCLGNVIESNARAVGAAAKTAVAKPHGKVVAQRSDRQKHPAFQAFDRGLSAGKLDLPQKRSSARSLGAHGRDSPLAPIRGRTASGRPSSERSRQVDED
jgi:hypothetical protein